jgi:tRNA-specific 2-thiouridylase
MGNAIKSDVKRSFKDKSESMGICFLQGLPYAEFLAKQGITMSEGEIVTESGEVCGKHNGIARYTIGQRRGAGIPEGMRVIGIDAAANHIIVGDNSRLYHNRLTVAECNIVNREELRTANDITIKIRGIGRNPERPVRIEECKGGYIVTTDDPAWAPALGQPIVFYRNNWVIGGGIVVGFN